MRGNRRTADLGKKKRQIWRNWTEIAKADERYESHPSKQWLDKKCKMRDVAKVVPDDITLINERKPNSIEIFQDFEILHKNTGHNEYIPLGKAWEFVVWEAVDEVMERFGSYNGLNTVLKEAVKYARGYNKPLVRHTSITMFDNIEYRENHINDY